MLWSLYQWMPPVLQLRVSKPDQRQELIVENALVARKTDSAWEILLDDRATRDQIREVNKILGGKPHRVFRHRSFVYLDKVQLFGRAVKVPLSEVADSFR
jgi:hypothetical protein